MFLNQLQVWLSTVRTLTGLFNTLTSVGASSTVIAASTLDLRPTANKYRRASIVDSGRLTAINPGLYDGTTFTSSLNQNIVVGQPVLGMITLGMAVQNNNAVSIAVNWEGIDGV